MAGAETESKVIKLMKEGKTAIEIAAKLKITRAEAKEIIAKYEIPQPPRPPSKTVQDLDESKRSKVEIEGGQEYLETAADELYKLVESRKEIKIAEASNILGVHESKVEEWGRILEEHDLIKMHYPPVGKPVLRIAEPKGKRKMENKEKEIKKEIKLRKGRRGRKIAASIIFLIAIFFVYGYLVNRQVFDMIVNVFGQLTGILQIITGNQIYLITAIIIIGIIVILIALKKKSSKIRLWWWKFRVKH